jgi:hypothetical protein
MPSERRGRGLPGPSLPARDRTDLRVPTGPNPPVQLAPAPPADPPEEPAVPPRHLAQIRRTPTPGLARSIVSAGLLAALVIALGAAAVLRAVHRPGQPGLRNGTAAAIAPRATAPDRTGPTGTTASPLARSVLPAIGQPLVLDGGFERDVAFMHERPSTSCRRVPGGATGRWAMAVTADGTAAGPPGLWLDLTGAAVPGSRWVATVKVRGHPGLWAEIRLYERRGTSVTADRRPLLLRDTSWHQIVAVHQFVAPGSVLGLDVRLLDASPGQTLTIDDLQARRTA